MWILFPALGAVFLILFLRERTKAPSVRAVFIKALTSVCFLGLSFCAVSRTLPAAWESGDARTAFFPLLILAGQLFGLLGDIWLDLKFVFPEEDKRFTNAGFVSFGVGHLLFAEALNLAFWRGDGLFWLLIPALIAVGFGIVLQPLSRKMGMDPGPFRGITVVYGILLCFVVYFAGSLLIRSGVKSLTLWLFFSGILLFAGSDLILGGTYFGTGKDRPVHIILNHVCYYTGQFLIAAAALAAV